MAYLLRLILAGLLLVASNAWATVPPIYGWKLQGVTMSAFDTPAAACSYGFTAVVIASIGTTYAAAGGGFDNVRNQTESGGGCYGWTNANHAAGASGQQFALIRNTTAQCPANSTGTSACTCASGYVQDATNTSCVLPADPCKVLAGQDAGDWVRDKGVNAAGTGPSSRSWSVCNAYNSTAAGKCVVSVSNAVCDEVGFGTDNGPGTGFYRCVGKGVFTGTSAIAGKCDPTSAGKGTGDSPADPSPATPPVVGSDPPKAPTPKPADGLPAPSPCKAGYAPGVVNGITSCYPTGSDTPKAGGVDSSTNNADGSKVTQHDETTCDAGGNKCATDTTKCTTAAGSSTPTCTTSSSTDSATGLCAKSPGNSVCAGGNGAPGSSFGGTCATGYKAVGEDPVLNAMAQEQYTRNCQVFATDKPESVVVANASDATGLQKATTAGDTSVAISSSNFDTSNALGGGGCSLNKTITVAHMTATLPFNVICDPLAYLGQVLVAVSLLLAARIVARG